ncbi:phosphoribosyl-AMP cyclohydrolase [Pelagibius sp. Alg239-R121]|uniref:phosphoribosyl-AMP cyclohydrolase n=1 Tax=Pelagibius sp. Alg239-R121 TaxID=2993448 RepID=UPI002AC33297|nr:phosphoribosyl-AMP cyclohydrolase [Pelagibius sp. Alg239-R121]
MATDKSVPSAFAARATLEQVEEGFALAPKFDADGLIPCITTDVDTGEVLMLGYMNAEALEKTIASGEAHYWSRSRQCLWRKGATSGLTQKLDEMRIDDDQDAVWLRVRVAGSALVVMSGTFPVSTARSSSAASRTTRRADLCGSAWRSPGKSSIRRPSMAMRQTRPSFERSVPYV